MITDQQKKHYETAMHYVLNRREKDSESEGTYPLNRGDILLLVLLIDQERKAASPAVDLKRLAAIREKLGDLVFGAPEMSKAEAQQFR